MQCDPKALPPDPMHTVFDCMDKMLHKGDFLSMMVLRLKQLHVLHEEGAKLNSQQFHMERISSSRTGKGLHSRLWRASFSLCIILDQNCLRKEGSFMAADSFMAQSALWRRESQAAGGAGALLKNGKKHNTHSSGPRSSAGEL